MLHTTPRYVYYDLILCSLIRLLRLLIKFCKTRTGMYDIYPIFHVNFLSSYNINMSTDMDMDLDVAWIWMWTWTWSWMWT